LSGFPCASVNTKPEGTLTPARHAFFLFAPLRAMGNQSQPAEQQLLARQGHCQRSDLSFERRSQFDNPAAELHPGAKFLRLYRLYCR
jgi:hypothetical protein